MKHDLVINSNGKAANKRRQRRRFKLLDKAVQKARFEIMAQEDAAIFKALDDAGKDE